MIAIKAVEDIASCWFPCIVKLSHLLFASVFMPSGSLSTSSLDRSANRLAEIVGVMIAVLTLTLPVTVIAYYSSSTEGLPSMQPSFQEAHR